MWSNVGRSQSRQFTKSPNNTEEDEDEERKVIRNPPRGRETFATLSNSSSGMENQVVEGKLKSIFARLGKRTIRHKKRLQEPVSSSSDSDDSSSQESGVVNHLPDFRSVGGSSLVLQTEVLSRRERLRVLALRIIKLDFLLDGQSSFYIGWLIVMGGSFLYNAWVIPLRGIFPYQDPSNEMLWLMMDSVCDFIYVVDTFLVQSRKKFIHQGQWIENLQDVTRTYFTSRQFKISLVALCPLDVILALTLKNNPWLRLPRLLKIETFWELFQKLDSALSSPYPLRIFKAVLYMLYLIHMYACTYYAVSTMEKNAGIVSDWIYEGNEDIYIRCFYFATKTATSIGKNPKPEHELEFLFMACAWLSGVFVFAVLIGQVRDIVATAAKNQTEYQELLSALANYLRRLEVSKELQEKALLWFNYTWNQQKTLDEGRILSLLPTKIRSDIALHVHIDMMSKVKLFRQCEAAFLRDLVLKLKSVMFLPGEYVCRKGEVGREMYIVKSGRVDVIVGSPGSETIIASLKSGTVFGEIALLQIGGMDKRTADVRSAGFSNLFMLTKSDINEVIRDYPVAQASLRRQARKLIKRSEKASEQKTKLIRGPAETVNSVQDQDDADTESDIFFASQIVTTKSPKLLDVVLQVAPADSKTFAVIRRASQQSHDHPD